MNKNIKHINIISILRFNLFIFIYCMICRLRYI